MDRVAPLIEHLERYLGEIQGGARLSPSVQGVWFADRPCLEASTFATLGLSHHILAQAGNPSVRIEFLLACRNEFVQPFRPMSVLADVADQALALHSVPPRGTVIGPRGRFFEASAMEALFCAFPVYFDDALSKFTGFSEPFFLVWLIPITAAEAGFIARRGWKSFEELLDAADPDLLNLKRASIVDAV